MELTKAESDLAEAIGFEERICLAVKERMNRPIGPIRRLARWMLGKQTVKSLDRANGWNDRGGREPASGLSIVGKRDEVIGAISDLQPRLLQSGYRAFMSRAYFDNGAFKADQLVVLKTTDQFDILRLEQTSGANYEVLLPDVLARLKDWQQKCEFEIIGATGDSVTIRFHTLPKDLCAFAEEIYRFCPDSVEQGVGLNQECNFPEAFAAARQLCPKLSNEMREKLADNDRQTENAMKNMPPEMRKLFKDSGFETPTEMGIRLLAFEIQRTMELFLWWD
jgi:hypothetical protein